MNIVERMKLVNEDEKMALSNNNFLLFPTLHSHMEIIAKEIYISYSVIKYGKNYKSFKI